MSDGWYVVKFFLSAAACGVLLQFFNTMPAFHIFVLCSYGPIASFRNSFATTLEQLRERYARFRFVQAYPNFSASLPLSVSILSTGQPTLPLSLS